jgi:hypothetical protein
MSQGTILLHQQCIVCLLHVSGSLSVFRRATCNTHRVRRADLPCTIDQVMEVFTAENAVAVVMGMMGTFPACANCFLWCASRTGEERRACSTACGPVAGLLPPSQDMRHACAGNTHHATTDGLRPAYILQTTAARDSPRRMQHKASSTPRFNVYTPCNVAQSNVQRRHMQREHAT